MRACGRVFGCGDGEDLCRGETDLAQEWDVRVILRLKEGAEDGEGVALGRDQVGQECGVFVRQSDRG